MRVNLLSLDPATYEPDPMHASDRCWTETNCYVDVWTEVLHALGYDPASAGAYTLSSDFDGDQWAFFKVPPEDLRALFGIEVREMNVWRPLGEHVLEQLEFGRLLTVEVDSYFLPDTEGVAYHLDHVKTTIVPQMIDDEARLLGYFHSAGYFELGDEDFDGIFRLGAYDAPDSLPPYVELVRLERLRNDEDRLVKTAVALAKDHLSRRPPDNPVLRLEKRIGHDLDSLSSLGIERFHSYAFGTCRQCGASAEIGASFVEWLARHDDVAILEAAEHLRAVAEGAKTVQFGLARIVAGRRFELHDTLAQMADDWEVAIALLEHHYGVREHVS